MTIADQLRSALKLALGLTVMALAVCVQTIVLVALLPSRRARIVACNYWGKVVGPILMRISGCPLALHGTEHLDANRPAIYISNHTSILDVFLAIFLSPLGTVGVAKKEVVWYPFFGQMYWLSGHLRVDRSNSDSAVASLRALADLVRRHRLSIYIWPEGTRSRDGRLLPFKKGIVHLAAQTGLPIVPIVVQGAHRSWEKRRLVVHAVPIQVDVLPPVDTSTWQIERVDDHLDQLVAIYREHLGEEQRPLALAAK